MKTVEKYAQDIGFQKEELEGWVQTLNYKKQIIFQGLPGTGITFIAQKFAQYVIGGSDGFSERVQLIISIKNEELTPELSLLHR